MGDIMSDLSKDKKYSYLTSNQRKREKFLKPLIVDEETKGSQDPFLSIVKNKKKNQQLNQETNYYLSPMRGYVKNRATFPVTSSKGRIDKQYDFIRDKKRLSQEELKKKYGSEYYEFNLISNRLEKQEAKKEVEIKKPFEPINFTVKRETQPTPVIQPQSPRTLNIIYEEEIELEDEKEVITSYQSNPHHQYYGDYQTFVEQEYRSPQVKQDRIIINEYHLGNQRDPKTLAEIKELFKDYRDPEPIYYETNLRPKTEPIEDKPRVEEQSFPTTDVKFNEPRFNDFKQEIEAEIHKNEPQSEIDYSDYLFPDLDFLTEPTTFKTDQTEWANQQMERLDATFESFGIAAKTVRYTIGPSVTRFEVEPEPGTKVSRITALADDIKLRLAARDIFIEAPISGKSTVGIEVPNMESRMVNLREILASNTYRQYHSPLKVALGLDITGQPIFSDISTMTHTLIAGSTGSGKSVCVNAIIVSILYNALPNEVKLVLIDPKKVEFSLYKDIPHLLTPVISDVKEATATLKWLTEEMDRRYELIESVGARDIKTYNVKRNRGITELPKLPYIVVIIDELSDLMITSPVEVEEYVQRISQLARAAGIHLIVATQRPSADVITGTIKTNIPSRIAFKVASSVDSRIILDENGAEKLLGKGDMLFQENGKPQLKRLQGAFISDDEIELVTSFCKEQAAPQYLFTSEDLVRKDTDMNIDELDELFDDVVRFTIENGEISASLIQRRFKVGYNRAARMIDLMEEFDIIGPHLGGSRPREVLVSLETYEAMIASQKFNK